MAISVRSIYLDKEIDAEQLKSIFDKNLYSKFSSFRDFVANDVRCPYCDADNGIYVKQKEKDGKIIANACFRFPKHNEHCVYEEKNKTLIKLNTYDVYYSDANDGITKLIRKFICAGIENHLFNQNDIRMYREWFRNTNFYTYELINIDEILINISKVSKFKENSTDKYYYKNGNVDIDYETYCFLHFKLGFFLKETRLTKTKYLTDFIEKNNNKKCFVFSDLKMVDDISKKADRLYLYIFHTHRHSYYRGVKDKNNITMSFICLLLYLSDWDFDNAKKLFIKIDEIESVENLDLGNVVGVNPLKSYSKYRSITILNNINKKIDFNLEDEFLRAKNELIIEYTKIIESEKNKKNSLLEDDLPF
ncbi:TPA: hypothetical protein ACX6Q2_003699 [Photobacterium damselae]